MGIFFFSFYKAATFEGRGIGIISEEVGEGKEVRGFKLLKFLSIDLQERCISS
jgi:hypothetical protein